MIRAIFFTVAFLALQLITGGVVTFAVSYLRGRGADVSLGLQLLLSTSLSSLVTIALFLWLKWSSVSRQYLLSRPWAVLCWSVVASLGTILPSLLLQELMPPLPEWWQQLVDESERQMTELMNMRGGYFLIAMLVPLAEEVVFRGAILRALLQLPHNR
jgi:membrane protease YdiL (CAAX protease family)